MAERLARLFGPAFLSGSTDSPTTLFTVPTGKIYVVRQVSNAFFPQSGTGSQSASSVLALGSFDIGNVFSVTTVATTIYRPVRTDSSLAVAFTEGEVVVGANNQATLAANPTWEAYQAAKTDTDWDASTTVDATTLSSGSFTPPGTFTNPFNVYSFVASTKASAPDTVSSIIDSHTSGFSQMTSIATAASSTVRTSIWGGALPSEPSGASTYDVTFGGTFTGAYVKTIGLLGAAAIYNGPPSTSDVVLQTATATGTTETTQTVTMTPTVTNMSFQLLVVCTDGVASSYTAPTHTNNGTVIELADSTLATPSSTAACYLIYPAISNPAPVIGSAGTSWSATCIEVAYTQLGSTTVNGIIIE